jgi:RNA 2',3'-cyclic 3'-phosphodiesterase
MVRVPAEALQPNLTALRGKLGALGGVRLHPDHFLHIMLQELGFVVESPRRPDEISAARLEEFAQTVVEPISSTRAFSVKLGGANSFQDAVFLDVRGGGRLARLHERLFDLAAMPTVPSYSYLPHCTIAHYDGSTPPDAAYSALAPWRNEVFGEFAITEAEIVTLDPQDAYPELATYAAIPFGS